jgi:hypothetical protein
MNSRCWGNLAVSFLVICMAPMTGVTNAGRIDEPWPTLLSSERTSDLRVAMLQYRANAMLEKLIQSAPTVE